MAALALVRATSALGDPTSANQRGGSALLTLNSRKLVTSVGALIGTECDLYVAFRQTHDALDEGGNQLGPFIGN